MDRMLYVAMTGAKETLRAQTVNNHNLANASTTGFRADLAPSRAARSTAPATPRASTPPTRPSAGTRPRARCCPPAAISTSRSTARAGSRCRDRRQRGLHARRRSAAWIRTASSRPAPANRCSATAARSACRRIPRSSSRATARSRIVPQGQTPDTTSHGGPHQAGQSARRRTSSAATTACSA